MDEIVSTSSQVSAFTSSEASSSSSSQPSFLFSSQATFISSSQTEGPLYSSLITHHPPPPSIGINLQDVDLPDDITNATDATDVEPTAKKRKVALRPIYLVKHSFSSIEVCRDFVKSQTCFDFRVMKNSHTLRERMMVGLYLNNAKLMMRNMSLDRVEGCKAYKRTMKIDDIYFKNFTMLLDIKIDFVTYYN